MKVGTLVVYEAHYGRRVFELWIAIKVSEFGLVSLKLIHTGCNYSSVGRIMNHTVENLHDFQRSGQIKIYETHT